MTMPHKDSSRLSWLAAALSEQRHRLVGLLQRLSGFGAPGAMKPSLFRKFLNMLDQISVVKERESEIISRIENIEAKHRFQRKRKGLKYAAAESKPQKGQNSTFECEEECERPHNGWLWILALLAFMSRGGINHKKHDLTVD
jgi:hypothetical protein